MGAPSWKMLVVGDPVWRWGFLLLTGLLLCVVVAAVVFHWLAWQAALLLDVIGLSGWLVYSYGLVVLSTFLMGPWLVAVILLDWVFAARQRRGFCGVVFVGFSVTFLFMEMTRMGLTIFEFLVFVSASMGQVPTATIVNAALAFIPYQLGWLLVLLVIVVFGGGYMLHQLIRRVVPPE